MEYEIGAGETVSEAVVAAVSRSEDRNLLRMDPLAETVDPDALNELFSGPSRCGAVSFVYSHSRVTVEHNEYIEVESVD